MAIELDAGQVDSLLEDELREPLLISSLEPEPEGQKHQWMVYLSTIVASCGSYAFGNCSGYSSPAQAALTDDLNLSTAEYSLFASILTFGAMIGAITSGPIADFIGRKGAIRVAVAFCIVGWLAIYFAQETIALDIGRLATGYGIGVFSFVIPIFIAEIAPKNIRGALSTLNLLMVCTGVSVSFVIGTLITWRVLALAGLVPCALLVIGLFFIPESPRWLAKLGRQKEFEAALKRLRGKDANISKETAEIQDYIKALDELPKERMIDLFDRRYLRSVTIGVGLMACQQLGGINGISFYATSIFQSAGFPSTIGTVIYAVLQVVITALGATLIDGAGRKPLLVVSGSGLALGCFLVAVSFYLKVQEIALKSSPIIAVVGLLVYVGSFSIGMGTVPWVVMSEIFPINIKGAAGSLATLVNWSFAWIVSYTFNFLMSWSSYGTFILYSVINALAVIFVMVVVPETKGRTLEQIQASINSKK